MPLTEFQRGVLLLLSQNRGPGSFVAGGMVINAAPSSPRFSEGVDIFHDVEENVAAMASADATVLAQAGFKVSWLFKQPGFQRAVASREGENLRLE